MRTTAHSYKPVCVYFNIDFCLISTCCYSFITFDLISGNRDYINSVCSMVVSSQCMNVKHKTTWTTIMLSLLLFCPLLWHDILADWKSVCLSYSCSLTLLTHSSSACGDTVKFQLSFSNVFVFCVHFQIKKLLNKPVVRESCYYRKLTDRGKDEPIPSFNDAQLENLLGEPTLHLIVCQMLWLLHYIQHILECVSVSIHNMSQ